LWGQSWFKAALAVGGVLAALVAGIVVGPKLAH
jgi:hypothetical protein